MLCVHIMDSYWRKLWEENQQFYSAIKRVAIDILIFLFIMFVRKIYKDSKNKEAVYKKTNCDKGKGKGQRNI